MVRRARQKAVDKAVDKQGKSGGNRVEKQLVGVYKVSTHFWLRASMKKAAPKSGIF